jgi:hypothetical protein
MDKIIFNILLVIIIIYIFFTNVENLENTGPTDQIKEAVKQVYLADVESIRNLSAVAKKLQEDGGLVTPANMSIRGKLNIGSTSNVKDLSANIALSVENATDTSIRLKTKADDTKNCSLTNNDGNFKMGNAKGDDLLNIKSDGNVAIKNGLTTDSLTTGSLTTGSLTTTGDITGKNISMNGNVVASGSLTSNTIVATTSITTPNLIVDRIRGINMTDYIPIVINFCGPTDSDNSLINKTFIFPNPSCVFYTLDNSTIQTSMKLVRERLGRIGRKEWSNCRNAGAGHNLTTYTNLTVSIPPGKQIKIFGWADKKMEKYPPGYYEISLSFSPHVIWAGLDAYAGDIPDFTPFVDLIRIG